MTKLIVALDCELEKAKYIVDAVSDRVKIFKVGPVLFLKDGHKILEYITSKGVGVFLDLKLFDIPNTIKETIKNILDMPYNIYSLSIHISAGPICLKEAKEAAKKKIKIWGITILTSIDKEEYAQISYRYSLERQVLHFSKLAISCGLDGIVISPREIFYIKKYIKGLEIITPSIRLKPTDDDQKRYLTPLQASSLGSDYIIVGRPILNSTNPSKTVDEILNEIKNGYSQNT